MYHRKAWEQITMYDFNQGFGFPISEDNRWVQLSKKIPWDEAEGLYAEKFTRCYSAFYLLPNPLYFRQIQ